MDALQMMASHTQDQGPVNDPTALSADELKFLAQQPFSQIKDIVSKMTPEEQKQFNNLVPVSAGTPGVSPNLLTGLIGASSKALQYLPSMSGIGRSAAGGAAGMVGWEGAKALATSMGAPPGIANLIGALGAGIGGHLGAGGASGAGSAARAGAEEIPDTFMADVAKAGGNPSRAIRPPEGPNALPDNLKLGPRSPDDVLEQVGRGVQNDFRGPVSLKGGGPSNVEKLGREDFKSVGEDAKPTFGSSKGARLSETNQGADDLNELLDRLHGTDRSNNPNGAPAIGSSDSAGLRGQSNVKLKRTNADLAEQVTRGGVKVDDHTLDVHNDDGALDGSRLDRLFADMNKKKPIRLKRK